MPCPAPPAEPSWAALTCGPLGQVEAVGVVHFGAAWLLTRNQLPSVPAAEALVLPFLHHLRLRPALHLRPSLHLLGLLLGEGGLALRGRQRVNTAPDILPLPDSAQKTASPVTAPRDVIKHPTASYT